MLAIHGSYAQTGGEIVFDVSGHGSGGFTDSKLDFNPRGLGDVPPVPAASLDRAA